ncbi:MAG: hypothetical protein JWM04_819 [Verrucomicrobiales bacterium]|nr:hypothetical protein [Verrucomicrobiales bacterium]
MTRDFDVLVIGGGTAGLVAAAGIAGLGGKVALAESNLMGGECLNFGCVPSKALVASSRAFSLIQKAGQFGIRVGNAELNFNDAMARMRELRQKIAPNDSLERFQSLGVHVFQSHARFLDPHRVMAGNEVVTAKRFVIASGSAAAVPNIPGLNEYGYFTNESIFDLLAAKPDSLALIGGGPIACELGQVFASMGVKVLIFQLGTQLLPREDEDAASLVAEQLVSDKIEILTSAEINQVVRDGDSALLTGLCNGKAFTRSAKCILVAAGRRPRVDQLGLGEAGVGYSEKGVKVNNYLTTSQPHIFAAGDVLGGFQFTHFADYQARVVVRNLAMPLQLLRQKVDYSALPWVTYTTPEIARVGINETEAKRTNRSYDLYLTRFEHVDRSILERSEAGFVKILTERNGDKILGATIVGQHAGELITEIVIAMQRGLGLAALASVVHSYPNCGDAIRKTADSYNKTRLKPWMKQIFAGLFSRGGLS